MNTENAVSGGIDVSILIVCYNSRDDIDRCLTSVLKFTQDISYEILLLDNSTDGTDDYVKDTYPSVRVVSNDSNLGFGGGNNKLAVFASGELVLLLNPDTELTDNAIKKLYDVRRQYPDYGAWGGVTFFPDGDREFSSLQVRPSIRNELRKLAGIGKWADERKILAEGSYEVHVLSGAFMMVEREVWQHLGGFDETYFLYSEEVDLSMRLEQFKGRPLLMTEQSSIIHYVGKSSSSADRTVYMFKGRMHLERKFHGGFHNAMMLLILMSWACSRYIYGCILTCLGKAERGRSLRERFSKVLGRPSAWIGGYVS